MPKLFLPTKISEIEKGIKFIETTFDKYHIKRKEKLEALLVSEEAMIRLIGNANENAQMQITIHRWYSTASVTLSAAGEEFKDDELQLDISTDEMGHDSEEAIRSLLLHAYADKIAYSRKGEYNFVKISAGAKERVFALRTLMAFAFALLASFVILPFISDAHLKEIVEGVLLPIQTIFLNALQLVTAPAIFFSIMTAIARFTSFSDPGRVSIKIFVGYILTSVVAVFLGIFVFKLFQPVGETKELIYLLNSQSSESWVKNDSLIAMLEDAVPNNIIGPFFNTNALQLLIIAVLGGIALGRAGNYSQMLNEIADALNRFFSGAIEIISNMIPTAVFFITLLMVLYFDLKSILIAAKIFGLVLLGFVFLIAFYLLVLVVFGHLNPLTFLCKYGPTMWHTFLSGSSFSSIPDTMRCCEKKFGISSKIYSFSIPIGSVLNLDGNCIYLTIVGLLLAKMCGENITGSNLITLVLMVIILSVGSPIAPGSVLMALTLLMNQMGLSLVILSIILGINAVIEMLLAMCNTVGDMVITLLVAKDEKLIDLKIYNKKE